MKKIIGIGIVTILFIFVMSMESIIDHVLTMENGITWVVLLLLILVLSLLFYLWQRENVKKWVFKFYDIRDADGFGRLGCLIGVNWIDASLVIYLYWFAIRLTTIQKRENEWKSITEKKCYFNLKQIKKVK